MFNRHYWLYWLSVVKRTDSYLSGLVYGTEACFCTACFFSEERKLVHCVVWLVRHRPTWWSAAFLNKQQKYRQLVGLAFIRSESLQVSPVLSSLGNQPLAWATQPQSWRLPKLPTTFQTKLCSLYHQLSSFSPPSVPS